VDTLFRGAVFPGLLLSLCYALFVVAVATFRPDLAPRPPTRLIPGGSAGKLNTRDLLLALVPSFGLIVLVLGSILWGIATPTEAGALGGMGALVIAGMRGRLSRSVVRGAARETTRLGSMVMTLLVASTIFALVFRGLDGDLWVEDLLLSLPGGKVGLLLFAHGLVFALGFFIDFFEIAFVVLPLLVPAARILGIDLAWFGVSLALNLQTSFLTPPFGFSLFYLRGVAPPTVKTLDIYRGAVPFILIQLCVLALVLAFPGILDPFGE
jgi:tripartite ATP-independent transporter DctM subunit